MITRLAVALLLGTVIGVERERQHRGAGLKTHALVSMGSAIFTIVSLNGFFILGRVNDPSRVAAQIVSGIGFLGAGTIMKQGANIRGLTTAASLWVVAGIGTAAGAGQYQAAIATTLLAVVSILLFKSIEQAIGAKEYNEIGMLLENEPGNIDKVQQVFNGLKIVMKDLSMEIEGNMMHLRMTVETPKHLDHTTLMKRLHEVGASRVEIT